MFSRWPDQLKLGNGCFKLCCINMTSLRLGCVYCMNWVDNQYQEAQNFSLPVNEQPCFNSISWTKLQPGFCQSPWSQWKPTQNSCLCAAANGWEVGYKTFCFDAFLLSLYDNGKSLHSRLSDIVFSHISDVEKTTFFNFLKGVINISFLL